jgi:hypothetical protein
MKWNSVKYVNSDFSEFKVLAIKSLISHCDVFDWRLSLLGNRNRSSSMDTLTTLVLLSYMVTNSRRAMFPLLLSVLKREDNTQS